MHTCPQCGNEVEKEGWYCTMGCARQAAAEWGGQEGFNFDDGVDGREMVRLRRRIANDQARLRQIEKRSNQ